MTNKSSRRSTSSSKERVWSDLNPQAVDDSGPAILSVNGLSKQYRLPGSGHEILNALNNVSLELRTQRVLAVVGESGSGKSTLAKVIAGHESPGEGSLVLDGREVWPSKSDFRHYKSQVQMVLQDPFASLNPAHNVRYHLERPVRLHQRLRGSALVEELHRLLEQVRLTPAGDYLAKYPHELSGGQRQRVAIARALAARPRVLLADEPVSMLDVSIRLEILRLIDSLRKAYDLAVMYITHDIASARYFADEIMVLYRGDVVEQGSAEEVTQDPQHPYTKLLIASSPNPDAIVGGSVIERSALVNRRPLDEVESGGCRFASRCLYVQTRCTEEPPPPFALSAGRFVRCFMAMPGWQEMTELEKEAQSTSL